MDNQPSLEDAILDPVQAEEIRASVDGVWVDADEPTPPGAVTWDFTRDNEAEAVRDIIRRLKGRNLAPEPSPRRKDMSHHGIHGQ